MKKFASLFLMMVLCVSVAAKAESGEKFAVVNLQRALVEVNAGKTARDKFKKEREAKGKEFETEQTKLKADADALRQQQSVLSQQAFQEKAQAIQDRAADMQKRWMEFEKQSSDSEAQITKEIITALQGYVQELAKQGNYTFVFENSAQIVLFAPNAADITTPLIELFNKKGMKK